MSNRDLLDYQEQYSKQPYEKYQVAFRKRKLIELLSKNKHDNLLEIGSGLESIFLDLSSYKQLTVVEPADLFYDKAVADQEKAKNKNIILVKALLEDAQEELLKNTYDFILVSSLLHEIPDHAKFFAALRAISSPDTILHFNVPNAKSFHRLLALEMGLIPSVYQKSESNIQFQQHTNFDSEILKETVEKHGFKVIESGSYSFKPFTHQQMQNAIDQNLITEAMLDGFYKMEKYLPGIGSEIYVNIQKN